MAFINYVTHESTFVLGIFFIAILCFWIYQQAYGTDVPFIKGIPEAPGSVPFFGHLKALGNDHPSKLQEWGVTRDWPVFQVKFGNRRFLVLNTFEAAQDFMVKNANATIDRPLFYTFHSILSTTQGMLGCI
jgi:phenylacetate 2-hydroxylase